MKILSSLSMISHPLFAEISCIYPDSDGTLNKKRVEYFAERAYRNGATGMRIFPGFLIDIKMFKNIPPEKWDYNYLPWKFDRDHQKFDLSRINEVYFYNLGEIARIINSKGLEIIFDMYDNCHWDNRDEIVPHSPWRFNINGVTSFYENNSYNDTYEDLVLKTLTEGRNVFMIGLCNEPKSKDQLIAFSKRLLAKLYKWEVRRDQIISGLEWFKGNACNPFYPIWRKKVDFFDFDYQGIAGGYKTLHGMHNVFTHKDVIEAQFHTSKLLASTDGSGVQKDQLKKALLQYFLSADKAPAKNRAHRWIFEALFFGFESDIDAVLGITEAVHEYFGFYPGCAPIPLDDLVDPGNTSDQVTEPKPKTIEERIFDLERRVAILENTPY
jgi:hypothetical protein